MREKYPPSRTFAPLLSYEVLSPSKESAEQPAPLKISTNRKGGDEKLKEDTYTRPTNLTTTGSKTSSSYSSPFTSTRAPVQNRCVSSLKFTTLAPETQIESEKENAIEKTVFSSGSTFDFAKNQPSLVTPISSQDSLQEPQKRPRISPLQGKKKSFSGTDEGLPYPRLRSTHSTSSPLGTHWHANRTIDSPDREKNARTKTNVERSASKSTFKPSTVRLFSSPQILTKTIKEGSTLASTILSDSNTLDDAMVEPPLQIQKKEKILPRSPPSKNLISSVTPTAPPFLGSARVLIKSGELHEPMCKEKTTQLPLFLIKVTDIVDSWNNSLKRHSSKRFNRKEVREVLYELRSAWHAPFCTQTPQHTDIVLRLVRTLFASPQISVNAVEVGIEIQYLLEHFIAMPKFFLVESFRRETLREVAVLLLEKVREKVPEICQIFFESLLPQNLLIILSSLYDVSSVRLHSLLSNKSREELYTENEIRLDLLCDVILDALKRRIFTLIPYELCISLLRHFELGSVSAGAVLSFGLHHRRLNDRLLREVVHSAFNTLWKSVADTSDLMTQGAKIPIDRCRSMAQEKEHGDSDPLASRKRNRTELCLDVLKSLTEVYPPRSQNYWAGITLEKKKNLESGVRCVSGRVIEWIESHIGLWGCIIRNSRILELPGFLAWVLDVLLPADMKNLPSVSPQDLITPIFREAYSVTFASRLDKLERIHSRLLGVRAVLFTLLHLPSIFEISRSSSRVFALYLNLTLCALSFVHVYPLPKGSGSQTVESLVRLVEKYKQKTCAWLNEVHEGEIQPFDSAKIEKSLSYFIGACLVHSVKRCLVSERGDFLAHLSHLILQLDSVDTTPLTFPFLSSSWMLIKNTCTIQKESLAETSENEKSSESRDPTLDHQLSGVVAQLLELTTKWAREKKPLAYDALCLVKPSICHTTGNEEALKSLLTFCADHASNEMRSVAGHLLPSALNHGVVSLEPTLEWFITQKCEVKKTFLRTLSECAFGSPPQHATFSFSTTPISGRKAGTPQRTVFRALKRNTQSNKNLKSSDIDSIIDDNIEKKPVDLPIFTSLLQTIAQNIHNQENSVIIEWLRALKKCGDNHLNMDPSILTRLLIDEDPEVRWAASHASWIACSSHKMRHHVLEKVMEYTPLYPAFSSVFLEPLKHCAQRGEIHIAVRVVSHLIRMAVGASRLLRGKIHKTIVSISQQHQTTVFQLLLHHPQSFASMIADCASSSPSSHSYMWISENYLERDMVNIIRDASHILIPHAVFHMDRNLLQYISEMVKESILALGTKNCSNVIAAILCASLFCEDSGHGHEIYESLIFLTDTLLESKASAKEIAEIHEKSIVEYIMNQAARHTHWRYEDVRQSTLGALTRLLRLLKLTPITSRTLEDDSYAHEESSEQVREIVAKHSFGLLDNICGQLGVGREATAELSSNTCTYEITAGFLALHLLIDILGSWVSDIAQKIRLLKPTEFPKRFYPKVASVWYKMIDFLPVDYLKQHSRDLLVDIVPFCASPIWDKNETYRLLVLKTIRVASLHCPQHSLQELSRAFPRHDVLDVAFRGRKKTYNAICTSKVVLRTRIREFIEALRSDSSASRLLFIKSLRRFLAVNQHIVRLLPGNDLVSFISCLLGLSCDLPLIAQQAVACLGCIGALASSAFTLRMLETNDTLRVDLLDPATFAAQVIQSHLVRLLHTVSDPKMHDRSAFAIQTLIRLCCNLSNLTLDELDGGKSSWWNEFPSEIKAKIRSFVQTSYGVKIVASRERHVPEYRSKTNYTVWIRLWFTNLSSRTEGLYGEIFKALRNVAKRDNKLCIFTLPYMLHHLIVSGTEKDVNELRIEFTNLFRHANEATEHVQLLFSLLDALGRWSDRETGRWRHKTLDKTLKGTEFEEIEILRRQLKHVENFQKSLPLDLCASAAHTIKASARALRYSELHMRRQREERTKNTVALPSSPASQLSWCHAQELQSYEEMYSQLFEPDGMLGFAALRNETSVYAEALEHEACGSWHEALRCNELLLQQEPREVQHQVSVLGCMRNLGQLQLMQSLASSLVQKAQKSSELQLLRDYQIQGAWRLSQWDFFTPSMLDEMTSYEGKIAKILFSFWNLLQSEEKGRPTHISHLCTPHGSNKHNPSTHILNMIQHEIDATRFSLIPGLAAASTESYERCYPILLQLHVLGDLEYVSHAFRQHENSAWIQGGTSWSTNWKEEVAAHLASGRALLEPSPQAQEGIISVHRSLFSILKLPNYAAQTWMDYSRLLCKFNVLPSALSAITQAAMSDIKRTESFMLLRAKILYSQGDQLQAIALLEKAYISSENNPEIPCELKAKWLMKVARWNIHTNQRASMEIESLYDKILELHPTEKAHAHMADFLESVYASSRLQLESKASMPGLTVEEFDKNLLLLIEKFIPRIVSYYGIALSQGHQTVYRSLLKFLSRWLDTSAMLHSHIARIFSARKGSTALAEKILIKLQGEVDKVWNRIPPYVYSVALPQLVSRIGIQNEEALSKLKKIIQRVILAFPRQSLWNVYFVVNSMNGSEGVKRSKVVKDILQTVSTESDLLKNIVEETGDVVRSLIAIASHPVSSRSERTISLSKISGLRAKFPTNVLLPTQENLSICLPSENISSGLQARGGSTRFSTQIRSRSKEKSFESSNFDASLFYPHSTTIHAILPNIDIILSLQKPKRITLQSNKGTLHSFLCKAKDETRKDSRMMEYSSMINRLTAKNTEARRRKLYIRTFSAVPLSDDCGIIEWVQNLTTLRAATEAMYQKTGIGLTTAELKSIKEKAGKTSRSAYKVYLEDVLPHFPPVLHQWFMLHFPEPASWFYARLNFTRTCATFSMVGHMIGLGDRHGENLMLDQCTGDCLHVDFACLFDKGETLEVPERVRFRLTPNMIDVMGITGTEGVFRKTCEITLRMQQENRDTLMGILESFVHDPLVEWARASKQSAEKMESRQILRRVDRRFLGHPDLYGESGIHSLNVEGLVQKLISSSTSQDNLSKMYFWWMPWL